MNDGGARNSREYVAEPHLLAISGAGGWSFCSCGSRTGPLDTQARVRQWHRFHRKQIAELRKSVLRKERKGAA